MFTSYCLTLSVSCLVLIKVEYCGFARVFFKVFFTKNLLDAVQKEGDWSNKNTNKVAGSQTKTTN